MTMSPETTVQRQLDAYNARDIDALMAIYADDAQMFEHPARLLASGWAALRERFPARFPESNLHAHLINRSVMGNIVIDHERVTRMFDKGPGAVELVMTYELCDGRIAKAWILSGPVNLDGAAAKKS